MIATTYPPCPDCGARMQLLRDTQDTTRGTPRTWWCPACTTHLRRRADGTWDVLDLTADGLLVHRPGAWGGQRRLHRVQALLADDRLHVTARLVGAALALRCDDTGTVQAPLRTVAQWAGCSWQHVWDACRELRAYGWLSWQSTRFRPTTYRLGDAPVPYIRNEAAAPIVEGGTPDDPQSGHHPQRPSPGLRPGHVPAR